MSNERFIKLIEVYSDIAGERKGASYGVDALINSCKEEECNYFRKFPAEVILDENQAFFEPTKFKHAKYIDKVSLVIERLASRVYELKKENFFPIILAGDHASSAGTMHGLKMAFPKEEIGVVYIDAHADIHSPYTSHSGNLHGMPLGIACGLDNLEFQINDPTTKEKKYWEKLKHLSGKHPAIKPENIVFCGLRDFQSAEEYLIQKHNIKKFTAQEITYFGIKTIIEEIFKQLNHCKHIYVSFDVDSIDPFYIPGTGTPSNNGLSFEQAMQLNMQLIKNEKVCAWEIAEINPLYDKTQEGTHSLFRILEAITKMLIKHY